MMLSNSHFFTVRVSTIVLLTMFLLPVFGQDDPLDNKKFQENIEKAKQGDAEAQFFLALGYDVGWGVPQDDKEAVRWFQASAEQGYARAQFYLGSAYDNGKGVSQDHEEAVRWYRKAAEQGQAEAQYNLGVSYRKGVGVPQDYKEAVQWYRKAANQGMGEAQWNLGNMYVNGLGVSQNYAKAAKLFIKAESSKWFRENVNQHDAKVAAMIRGAENGMARDQFDLARQYYYGRGIAQDYTEAFKWYRKAARAGSRPGPIRFSQTLLSP